MVNCEKETALMLAQALVEYGVTDVFASPGTRCAPLTVALARAGGIRVRAVVDERSAAFIALGYASVAQRPAMLVCTSGTALLNYAPAVAEAYYRKVPLLIVSADRPQEWIDQDDGQTLTQPGAFGRHVKGSFVLRGEITSDTDRWSVNRTLNDAMQLLRSRRQGPVHLNISFAEPLFADTPGERPAQCRFRKISLLEPSQKLDAEMAKQLADEISGKRVLVAGGFCAPSAEMNRAFAKLAALPDVVVLADALANISVKGIFSRPELILQAGMTDYDPADDTSGALPPLKSPGAAPDLLITFGGSMLSRRVKEWLRGLNAGAHWHVGANGWVIDSFFSLTRRIEIAEKDFFPRLANALEYVSRRDNRAESSFRSLWEEAQARADAVEVPDRWCARTAIESILDALPAEWNLQLSNGLTPRYAMMTRAASKFHRRDCNRGVSGIDGSASTALGASLAYKGTTLLITGDMSMQYDIAALSSGLLTPRFKIVVINNNGGDIFRKITATRELPEVDDYLACHLHLPLKELCAGYGISYYRAATPEALRGQLIRFRADNRAPSLLEIIVPE